MIKSLNVFSTIQIICYKNAIDIGFFTVPDTVTNNFTNISMPIPRRKVKVAKNLDEAKVNSIAGEMLMH